MHPYWDVIKFAPLACFTFLSLKMWAPLVSILQQHIPFSLSLIFIFKKLIISEFIFPFGSQHVEEGS